LLHGIDADTAATQLALHGGQLSAILGAPGEKH
jgi:hypothetical protein